MENYKLKEFKPEDIKSVKVGDIYLASAGMMFNNHIVPMEITGVEKEGFSYKFSIGDSGGSGYQAFNEPIQGILVRKQNTGLELLVSKIVLEGLKKLEK
jgi:hypothetical protein